MTDIAAVNNRMDEERGCGEVVSRQVDQQQVSNGRVGQHQNGETLT